LIWLFRQSISKKLTYTLIYDCIFWITILFIYKKYLLTFMNALIFINKSKFFRGTSFYNCNHFVFTKLKRCLEDWELSSNSNYMFHTLLVRHNISRDFIINAYLCFRATSIALIFLPYFNSPALIVWYVCFFYWTLSFVTLILYFVQWVVGMISIFELELLIVLAFHSLN